MGYGAKEYPAEYGLHLVVTKSEVLGPDTAAELKRCGLPYTAAVMEGYGNAKAFVFCGTPATTRAAGGLMARAIGEIRAGFDAEDTLVAMLAAGDGMIYVQATEDVAKGLAAYRSLWERATGITVHDTVDGMATGELPPAPLPERSWHRE